MNALDLTLRGFSMLGKPRAEQTIHVCKSLYSDRYLLPRHLVLIGSSYFEVSSRGLQCLRDGMTPDDLDLDPMTDEEAEAFGGCDDA